MGAGFEFAQRLAFSAENAEAVLREVPAAPGVFALRGEDPAAEPYLMRAADLRRRIRRVVAPPDAVDADGKPVLTKRLNLGERVRWIEYTLTGSEFESVLVLYCATRAAFGAERARQRLKLRTPFLLRMTMENAYPRVYVTNRLSGRAGGRALSESFGPFPSRAAAERYCDAVLDLFLLRRCYEDLAPYPEHPGCVYGEMKKCLEPCKVACSAEAYAAEAARVRAFFATRGESLLSELAAKREAASEAMDFEQAAQVHKQWEKAKAAAALADEIVRPVTELRAVVLQSNAQTDDAAMEAAAFLFENGRLEGPVGLSALGVRAVREQTAVGSSLFAQPLMLAPTPLASLLPDEASAGGAAMTPEDRARRALAELERHVAEAGEPTLEERSDALAMFRRWYYRPEKQRAGEVFLPDAAGGWPLRRMLNGAARLVLGPPAEVAPVDREAFRQKAASAAGDMEDGTTQGGDSTAAPAARARVRKRKSAGAAQAVTEPLPGTPSV